MKSAKYMSSENLQNVGLIKKMPSYDPDAEILSLALTIPSWINSIKMVYEQADFKRAGTLAKYKLAEELETLKNTADKAIYAAKEKK